MPKLNPDDSLIGAQLGDYILTRMLATGGMARVYEGIDHKLKRHAAIKVLDSDKLSTDLTLRQRFLREARAIARLEHPNIITIYQYGEQDGIYFLAMKLIRGNDLAHELSHLRQAGERMEVTKALLILEQIAGALDVAHAANIVHRDIKPSNILLDQTHHAILTDFGLVFQPSVDTTSGASFGTPRYIAPEQAMSSSNALPQSDLYSLGVIAYQMLVGQTPFTGDSPLELALAHISAPPPPPRSLNPDIPEAAERELLKALEKDPDKRHATATEFVSALKRAYAHDSPSSTALVLSPIQALQIVDERDEELPTSIMPTPAPLQRRRKRLPYIPVAVVATILTLIAAVLLLPGGDNSGAVQQPTQAATEGVAATSTTSVALLTPPTSAPTQAQAALVSSEGEMIVLRMVYSDSVFALINPNERDLETSALRFERGADLFDGSNIVRQVLPAGTCFRLQLQGRQNPLPPDCERLHAETLPPDPQRFFWRAKDGSAEAFEVYYAGQLLTTCPTVERGTELECSLTLTVPPAG